MAISYTYIFQFCVILQCMTLWRSGLQSPACALHFTDVFNEFQYFQDGDLIIGGVFTVRSKIDLESSEKKIYSPSIGYYWNLLAFLFAIDNINRDPNILPNISLGFHLYDSWLEPRKGVQSVLQILSGPNGTIPNYSCKGQGKLAGVIGDRYSSTTIPIAQILGLYKYTQISYWATDYSLSDRLLYPHVFRTIQNDYVHYLAIAKLVKYFGWNWVGIFLSDNDTGENEAQILKKHLASQEICVAFEKRMTDNSATINQWRDTLSKVPCKVLILCGSFTNNVQGYLSAYTHINRNNMFILPPGWTFEEMNIMIVFMGFITSLSLSIFDPPIHIDENLFGINFLSKHSQIGLLKDNLIVTFHNITSTQNGENIYFQNVCNSTRSLLRMRVRIIDKHIIFRESLRVYIAVEAMAEAIQIFNKFNHSFNINRFNQLHKYVKQIKNPYKTADRITFFDQNGEFPFYYRIVNGVRSYLRLFLRDIDVGSYTPWAKEEDKLHIDPTNITWDEDNNTMLESRCVDSCLPGYRKKPGASIHACCYDCVPCSEGQISNMTGLDNWMFNINSKLGLKCTH